MLSLFVPCPTRFGFSPYFQKLKQKHIDTEFKNLKPTLFSDGLSDSFAEATLFSIFPCVIAKCVFSIAWSHLALIAGTFFILTFLTTPISSCYSPILYCITNLTNALTFLAIIIAHGFYTSMDPSLLSMVSLVLMIATPFADTYADILSAEAHQAFIKSKSPQEERLLRCILWEAPEEDDPTKNMSTQECSRIRESVFGARYMLRSCLTIAWGCLYALAPVATNPLQKAFTSALLMRNIFMFLLSEHTGF